MEEIKTIEVKSTDLDKNLTEMYSCGWTLHTIQPSITRAQGMQWNWKRVTHDSYLLIMTRPKPRTKPRTPSTHGKEIIKKKNSEKKHISKSNDNSCSSQKN